MYGQQAWYITSRVCIQHLALKYLGLVLAILVLGDHEYIDCVEPGKAAHLIRPWALGQYPRGVPEMSTASRR